MVSASLGTWVNADYSQVTDNTPMITGNLYAFKQEKTTVRAMGYLSQVDAINAFLDVGALKTRFLKAYKEQTGEDGEVKYIYVSYEKCIYGGSLGVWLFTDCYIIVLIKDVGFALTAAVIIALAVAFAVVAFTLITSWLIFTAVESAPENISWLIALGLALGAGLLLYVIITKGKGSVSPTGASLG